MLNSRNASVAGAEARATAGPSASLVDAMTEDERRLAAELAELLGRRQREFGEAARAAAPLVTLGPSEPSRGFAWQPEAGKAVEDAGEDADIPSDLRQGAVPASTVAWLAKARSDRRSARAHRAGAWLVTLLVGGTIIAGAAYLLNGRDLGLGRFTATSTPSPEAPVTIDQEASTPGEAAPAAVAPPARPQPAAASAAAEVPPAGSEAIVPPAESVPADAEPIDAAPDEAAPADTAPPAP
jgi:hypothetical protein